MQTLVRRVRWLAVPRVALIGGAAAFLSVPKPLPAQAVPAIPLGASVRITPVGAARQEGRLAQLSADSIWIRVPGRDGIRRQSFALAEVTRLEVWQRDARTRTALHWSLGGAAVGFIAGALSARRDGGEYAVLRVPYYVLGGALAGAALGASSPPNRWVSVWPPEAADFPRRGR